jgi:hypothetical protein
MEPAMDLAAAVQSLSATLATRGRFRLDPGFDIQPTVSAGGVLARFVAGKSQITAELARLPDGTIIARVIAPLSTAVTPALEQLLPNGIAMSRLLGSGAVVQTANGRLAVQFQTSVAAEDAQSLGSVFDGMLRSVQWPVLSLQGRMRRANLTHLVAEPDPEDFWAETDQEAASALMETSTEPKTLVLGGITVHYTDELAGGGETFGEEAIEFVRREIGPVESAYEWCAGPGFLGYSLFGNELCRSLCLADINPRAVEVARHTARTNGLEHAVRIYESDCLDGIPVSEQWNLVLGNPPWTKSALRLPNWGRPIKYQDPDLRLHRRFFRDVRPHLRPGASLVILECYLCTSESDFEGMLKENQLELRGVYRHRRYPYIYYLRIKATGD